MKPNEKQFLIEIKGNRTRIFDGDCPVPVYDTVSKPITADLCLAVLRSLGHKVWFPLVESGTAHLKCDGVPFFIPYRAVDRTVSAVTHWIREARKISVGVNLTVQTGVA